ncbi:MAG: hypothetical protein GTO14_03155 [Anaerolineales bacterium]|nr:hypothetical protein [Anaerolineales bacterium]
MRLGLNDGGRVCIVGGGPAGSFAAIHLLNLMRQHDLKLKITIFEPRDFSRPGPGGCNRCAGVLSSRLLSALESVGLSLPEEVVQAKINSYAINLDGEVLNIHRPDPSRRILSIYRGAGPRLTQGEVIASFDNFLLREACSRGAEHVNARVRVVSWEGKPVVYTAQGRHEADLLVLATGVNSRAPLNEAFGYRPPKTAIMAQDEVLRPEDWQDDEVSTFLKEPPGLIFGALIPKGRYLNISLLGRDLATDAISEFIEAQKLNLSIPFSSGGLCGCTPRIAIRPARGFYGDRWVAVGDAAVSRLYKDGIGSAFSTAEEAMKTAIEVGISRTSFRKSYAPFCKKISTDNTYGRILFNAWSLTQRIPLLLRGWSRAIQAEENLPAARRIHARTLWGMFTGDELYRDLLWRVLNPTSMITLLQSVFRVRRE